MGSVRMDDGTRRELYLVCFCGLVVVLRDESRLRMSFDLEKYEQKITKNLTGSSLGLPVSLHFHQHIKILLNIVDFHIQKASELAMLCNLVLLNGVHMRANIFQCLLAEITRSADAKIIKDLTN